MKIKRSMAGGLLGLGIGFGMIASVATGAVHLPSDEPGQTRGPVPAATAAPSPDAPAAGAAEQDADRSAAGSSSGREEPGKRPTADDAPTSPEPEASPEGTPSTTPEAEETTSTEPEDAPVQAAPSPEASSAEPSAEESSGEVRAQGEAATVPAAPQEAFDQRMVTLINAERAAADVPELEYWGGLRTGALAHSTWMDGNDFEHAASSTVDADTTEANCAGGWAENIYWSSSAETSPQAAMDAYMNSAGHRANILHEDLRFVATGTVTTENGLFNTQRFAFDCG